jgi:aminopeptidase
MFEDFAPKLADVLTRYSAPVNPGDKVGIIGSTSAAPLIEALYEAVLRRGGHPIVDVRLPNLFDLFLRLGNEDQLDFLDPSALTLIQTIDIRYAIAAPDNTRGMSGVDPVRLTRVQRTFRPYWETYRERRDAGHLRWNVCAWPTTAAAQDAEMSLIDYREFVYRACGLDQPDPVAYWQSFRDRQTRLADWTHGKSRAEVHGPGIDLTFDFGGRIWKSAHGEVNMPDGEVYTSPVETSVNGHIEFSYPTRHGGREVSGVKLTFKDGVVVEASAAKGEDYLLSQLNLDEGARRLGEFAIGTNAGIQRFTGDTGLDEKIGGTIHVALGNAYADVGGTNNSAIHWDMVHGMRDGGEIWLDGELYYRSGTFAIE